MNWTPLKEISNSHAPVFQNSELKRKFIEQPPLYEVEKQWNKENYNSIEATRYLQEKIAVIARENGKLNDFILKKDKEFHLKLSEYQKENAVLSSQVKSLQLSNSLFQETLQKKQEAISKQEKEFEEENFKQNHLLKEADIKIEAMESQLLEANEELRIYSELESRSESLIAENLKLTEALYSLNNGQVNQKKSKRKETSKESFKEKAKAKITELKAQLNEALEEGAKFKEDAYFYQEELAIALEKLENRKSKAHQIEDHLQKVREELKARDEQMKDPSFMSSIETAHDGDLQTTDRVISRLENEKKALLMELDLYKDMDSKIERLVKENERLNSLLQESSKVKKGFKHSTN